jgi:hypothetical protein
MLNVGMICKQEMRKEVGKIMVHLKELSGHMPEGTKENCEKSQFKQPA